MTEEKKTYLNSDNAKACRDLMRMAAGDVDKAEALLVKAGERHENLLIILKESGVPWNLITRTIQTEVFPDWPKKPSGLPEGYQALMEQGYKPALYFNRFKAYRDGKYQAPPKGSDQWGKLKAELPKPPKMADLAPEERVKVRIQQEEKATEARISRAHVISEELVRHSLMELFTFALATGNKKAQDALKICFEAFGFAKEGTTIGPLKETVKTPKGEYLIPPEAKGEEEKKVANSSPLH